MAKHQHFLYVFGLQPKRVIEDVSQPPLCICPQEITVESMKKFGIFHRIGGTKQYCEYVLVYDKANIRSASDPKLRFPRVVISANDMFLPSTTDYVQSTQLTVLSSPCVVRRDGLLELDQACIDMMDTLKTVCSTSSGEELSLDALKKLQQNCQSIRYEISQCKLLTLKEEDIRNRIMFEDLASIILPHGFSIGLNRLEGFTLPVTEFGRSRNDHCIIHHQRYYKMENLRCAIVIPSVHSYQIEEGNATAGVVEFKNDAHAVDQAIAEMLRTAGDILLAVLADKRLIRSVTIVGLAASYKTADAKLVKLGLNCIDETAEVVQSRESIPFCEALNIVLNAIAL